MSTECPSSRTDPCSSMIFKTVEWHAERSVCVYMCMCVCIGEWRVCDKMHNETDRDIVGQGQRARNVEEEMRSSRPISH